MTAILDLAGKKGLIVGIANDHNIAYGCAHISRLDGLMMGTRCGALDPVLLLYLLTVKNMSVPELSNLFYHESGLKGVSTISDDMQELLASNSPVAQEAVELYCTLAAKEIAAMMPALGGLDALIFTGGIGENAVAVRERIIELLSWIKGFEVYVIPTDEELVIAESCRTMLKRENYAH